MVINRNQYKSHKISILNQCIKIHLYVYINVHLTTQCSSQRPSQFSFKYVEAGVKLGNLLGHVK